MFRPGVWLKTVNFYIVLNIVAILINDTADLVTPTKPLFSSTLFKIHSSNFLLRCRIASKESLVSA